MAGQLSRHGDRRDWISSQGLQPPVEGHTLVSGPPRSDWSWGPAADAQPPEPQETPDHAQRLDASPTALCARGTTLRDTGVSIMCGGSFSIRVRKLEAWPCAALM